MIVPGRSADERAAARTSRLAGPLRAAAVLALLAVATIGSNAVHRTRGWSGLGSRGAGPVVTDLASVLLAGGALAVLLAFGWLLRAHRLRRRRPEELQAVHVVERRHSPAQVLVLLGALVLGGLAAVTVIALARTAGTSSSPTNPTTVTGAQTGVSQAPSRPATVQRGAPGAAGAVAIGGAVAAAAGVGYAGYRWSRHQRTNPGGTRVTDRARRRLAAAVAEAGSALSRADSPRAAILACYRAMQRSLAHSGVTPHAADTPEDVLSRAAQSGLALPAAADRLVELFREARFSSHLMTTAQRGQAEDALSAIVRSLEQRT